jgi:hypothetical protein
MPTKTTRQAASGIVNGHWEPTPRRPKFLAVAREGIAKFLRTREHAERASESPTSQQQNDSRH